MKVAEVSFPSESLLFSNIDSYNYADTFEGTFETQRPIEMKDVVRAFFNSTPSWVGGLMRLRNAIVGKLGLKTDNPSDGDIEEIVSNFQGQPGESIGLFHVLESNEHEIIFGEEDKHLDFKVSLLKSDNKRIAITTVVIFNNIFGKIYFFPVRPFHKVIVKTMLKGVVKELSRE